MNNAAKTVFKWFWAWEDEKEEAWLRQMSQAGWHLQKVRFPTLYRFQAGEPRDYVYRLDFHRDRKDHAAYLQLFQDAGWAHLGEYASWQYFRIEAQGGQAPEIYSDTASKLQKYQRVLAVQVALLPVVLIGITRLNTNPDLFLVVMTFVWFILFVAYMYALIMMLRRVQQLKKLVK